MPRKCFFQAITKEGYFTKPRNYPIDNDYDKAKILHPYNRVYIDMINKQMEDWKRKGVPEMPQVLYHSFIELRNVLKTYFNTGSDLLTQEFHIKFFCNWLLWRIISDGNEISIINQTVPISNFTVFTCDDIKEAIFIEERYIKLMKHINNNPSV